MRLLRLLLAERLGKPLHHQSFQKPKTYFHHRKLEVWLMGMGALLRV